MHEWYSRWIWQLVVRRAERKSTQWCLFEHQRARQWLIFTFAAAHRTSATQEAVQVALVEATQHLHDRMGPVEP